MASFTETFTQGNGTLAGWSTAGLIDLVVVSNKCSTNSNTGKYGGLRSHGLTVSGDWQIDFDVLATLTIGNGGATVALINSGTGDGYSIFAGNATHVQVYSAGVPSNITNDTRPNAAGHVTMTHTAAGVFTTYQDGVFQGTNSDTSKVAGASIFLVVQESTSPTVECTVDNLVIQDFIGVALAPVGLPFVRSAARMRASTR